MHTVWMPVCFPGNIDTAQTPLACFTFRVAAIIASFTDEKPGDITGRVQWQHSNVFTASSPGFDRHDRFAGAECVTFHHAPGQQYAGWNAQDEQADIAAEREGSERKIQYCCEK